MTDITNNEYCLREILAYCTPQDYIALAQVSEQFKHNIQDILQRNLDKLYIKHEYFILKVRQFKKIAITLSNLEFVLEMTHRFVKRVLIENDTEELWNITNKFVFAEADELALINIGEAPMGDNCFPNLRTLKIHENSLVRFKTQWSNVENLVIDSKYMEETQIIEYFSHMKLKTLQVLYWENDLPSTAYGYFSDLEEFTAKPSVMFSFLEAFERMTKLKKLVVANFESNEDYWPNQLILNPILLNKFRTRIVEVMISTHLDTYADFMKVSQLPHLRRISLTSDLSKWIMPRNVVLLKAIYVQTAFYEPVTAKILNNILTTQQYLEFLQLSNCRGKLITLDVQEISKHRTIPVTINLHFTYAEEFEILLSAPTDLIKITKLPDAEYPHRMHFILD